MENGIAEIILPWPSRKLHPNTRCHWAVKHKAAQDAREQGRLHAMECHWHRIKWPEGKLHLWIDGYAPDKRRRDHDGFLSSLKPWLDGVADAMRVDDSRFVPHPFIKDEVCKGGRVHIRITAGPDT